MMNCRKCNNRGSIILRKTDSYCNDCFITNINHKFRACIGKNKILSKQDKVLVCLSGGLSSTVLMDLIHNGISMESHKKLRIEPIFLHVIDVNNDSNSMADYIREQCEKYNWQVHLLHISQYMESDSLCLFNETPCMKNREQFNSLLKSMPLTASNDLVSKIKRNMFVKCAKILKCNFVFTAEASSKLAINLLSNITLGRGSQVENDVGFCDARNAIVKILRPMKDITEEELRFYVDTKGLKCGQSSEAPAGSLQFVIQSFVSDLQNNFPATISTVCKTADKIGVINNTENEGKCIICESDLSIANTKLTAFEATRFSRAKSSRIIENIKTDETSKSLFPFIHDYLCYACSRNYSEIDEKSMPDHINKLLYN